MDSSGGRGDVHAVSFVKAIHENIGRSRGCKVTHGGGICILFVYNHLK